MENSPQCKDHAQLRPPLHIVKKCTRLEKHKDYNICTESIYIHI